MKRIIKILMVFTSFLLLQVSCSEEFLEPKPLSFYAPENVFVDKAGFISGLERVRKDMLTDFYGNRSPLNTEMNSSDIGVMGFAGNLNTVTPSSGTFHPYIPLFARIYSWIKNTNVIISRIDNIDWDRQEDRNNILAEALFFRSYWYYRLITTYGDVPFLGQELTGAKLDFYTHSKFAISKKIQSDLEYAVEVLPEVAMHNTPSKYAALHLLSKVYLINLEFDKAITATTTIINGPHALMTERFGAWLGDGNRNLIWDIHRPENKALTQNTETIFLLIDRFEAPPGAKTTGTFTHRNYHCTWWHAMVRDSEGLHGTKRDYPDGSPTPMGDSLGNGNPDFVPSPWHGYTMWGEAGYNWRNTPDLRRADINWVDVHELLYNRPTSVNYGEPLNPNWFARTADSILTMYPFPYYKTYFPHDPTSGGLRWGGNGDMYVFRLAETYLIRAEAHYWKDQLGPAAADINMVRERANAVPITAADVTIDYIFDERARELYMEEMRHTELVRVSLIKAQLNRGGYTLANLHESSWYYDRVMRVNVFYEIGQIGSYIYTLPPRHIFWPIDATIIVANTLGVINQNLGYEGDGRNVPPLEVITDDD